MVNDEINEAAEALKGFFRNHASGVAIITGLDLAGGPLGFTATSLTSLGTKPPLVSFNVAQGASFYKSLLVGRRVNLHALGLSNLELASRLAGPREHRFELDNWRPDTNGVPVFEGTVAILHCEILQIVEVEQNAVVIVRALDGEQFAPETPLLYHQRAFIAGGELLRSNG